MSIAQLSFELETLRNQGDDTGAVKKLQSLRKARVSLYWLADDAWFDHWLDRICTYWTNHHD